MLHGVEVSKLLELETKDITVANQIDSWHRQLIF